MPSYKDAIPIHSPHPLGVPPPHLEAEDAIIAEGFSPCATTCLRNAYRLSDALACDDFRMYDYKVRRCMRGKSHDWTNCPFAHRGEKARRRDPRKIHYSGEPCPDFRKGSCRRGDACMYAHGVFECWLHPARYRTQPCKDGKDCKRKVCFFAHSMQQLRHVAAPVEESLVEDAPTMDLYTPEPYSHVQELGLPVGMGSMEDFFKEDASRVESYEQYEGGRAQPTNSSALSSRDVCNAHVGSVSETLSMLIWSSETQNLSSSPYEPISSIGFSLIHPLGLPLEVHPPSPNLYTVAPVPVSSGLGAKNNLSLFEQSIAPPIFSSGSPSQQAAARQAFLLNEGYGKGGESILNVSADEVSDMVHYGGYGGTTHGYITASRRGGLDANEVANELNGTPKVICSAEQLALLEKDLSSYSSCGSYGLSSPTSTLAGPLYISSFSSPPLSPLNTPTSDTSNIFSLRGHSNVAQVDDRIPKADDHILRRHCVKELESKHISTDQEFLHANHHSQLLAYGAFPQCLELPSTFSLHTSRQNKWIPLCSNWNTEGTYEHGIMPNNMWQKVSDRLGEGGLAENTMPDLGWVCELVM